MISSTPTTPSHGWNGRTLGEPEWRLPPSWKAAAWVAVAAAGWAAAAGVAMLLRLA